MESTKTSLGIIKFEQDGVQKQLTGEQKYNGLTIYQGVLNCYHNEGDTFLRCIFTGDETWNHHHTPESTCQSMERKNLTLPDKKKFKTQLLVGK
jgi:hypothetical protein